MIFENVFKFYVEFFWVVIVFRWDVSIDIRVWEIFYNISLMVVENVFLYICILIVSIVWCCLSWEVFGKIFVFSLFVLLK